MNAFMREVVKAAKESPRLFFAPLVGAIEAVRREMDHLADRGRREVGRPHSSARVDDQR